MMADNLAYMAMRERGRGKVLAFAHNMHLQRGQARWQLGDNALAWWPAERTWVQCSARATPSSARASALPNQSASPHPGPGTLEASLTAARGPARFIPTHRAKDCRPRRLPHCRLAVEV